jgi:leucyl-tRNA synthetase
LANDEVKDGFSERGGYPVEQKKMMQWSMRITAYAERLLQGLNHIDWPEPLKEMQRNWIGKSTGASVRFPLDTQNSKPTTQNYIEVFTTRVDTIFGVTFLVIAPEHELVAELTTPAQKAEIDAYITQTKKKSELDRMADAKTVSGAFTGSFVINR